MTDKIANLSISLVWGNERIIFFIGVTFSNEISNENVELEADESEMCELPVSSMIVNDFDR